MGVDAFRHYYSGRRAVLVWMPLLAVPALTGARPRPLRSYGPTATALTALAVLVGLAPL